MDDRYGTKLFPRGLATGPAFCNRTAEKADLKRRMAGGDHTWLSAPRRYGKTSLLHQVLLGFNRRTRGDRVRGVVVDLLPSFDQVSFQTMLLQAVGELSGAVLTKHKRLLEAGLEFLGSLRPKLVVSAAGVELQLTPLAGVPETLVDALLGLDRIAGAAGARACLVLDEFQQVATLRDGRPLEAAIRHAVERARYVTYVFSGSHRHLLEQLFTDSARPLYLLCEPMRLERIAATAYLGYLERSATLTWNRPIAREAMDAILSLTERHPYYVNLLCAQLWRANDPPGANQVAGTWTTLVATLRNWLAGELDNLSPTQRAVLAELSAGGVRAPTSREFVARTRLAKSSLAQALETLEHGAHVARDENGLYKLIDPALAAYLRGTGVQIPR